MAKETTSGQTDTASLQEQRVDISPEWLKKSRDDVPTQKRPVRPNLLAQAIMQGKPSKKPTSTD